jgi:hypothetical protein
MCFIIRRQGKRNNLYSNLSSSSSSSSSVVISLKKNPSAAERKMAPKRNYNIHRPSAPKKPLSEKKKVNDANLCI